MNNFEENTEFCNEADSLYSISDTTKLKALLEDMEDKWSFNHIDDIFELYKKNFGVDKNLADIDLGILQINYKKILYDTTALYINCRTKLENFKEEYSPRFDKLYYSIYYGERFIRDIYLINRTKNEHHDPLNNEDPDVLFKFGRFTDPAVKFSPLQYLLLYFLDLFPEEGFAKYGDSLYKPIYKGGYNTHAWKKICTIKEYIYQKTCHRSNLSQWRNSTSSGCSNLVNTEKYFLEFTGPELPSLDKDRYLFSFKNGNYITKFNVGTEDFPIYKDIFVPYGTEHKYLNSYSVSSKYHDEYFNNFDDLDEEEWFEIINHCPNFKSILDYQDFPEEIQRWLCIFMGRQAFTIGDLDNWQAMLYVIGPGGVGKSTILMNILNKWYENEDVGVISNNIDSKFGIKQHATKFMVLAPEISDSFKMEQTEWQLIVEGGRNTYQEKYKKDETISWINHVMFSGNKLFKFKNNSDSVSRRVALLKFWKKVVNVDTHLDKKLLSEIPIIMKLCVSGYHWAIKKYGKKGIWNILPEYFQEHKIELEKSNNSLQHFLSSGKIIYGKSFYVPENIFKQAFNDHCKENNFPKEEWKSDFFSDVFTSNGIRYVKEGGGGKTGGKEYPRGSGIKLKRVPFLHGIDVADYEQEDYGNDPE